MKDNIEANVDEARRLMRVVAEVRIPRTQSLVDTAIHFSEYFPEKRQTLDDILVALKDWSDGTSSVVITIRKEMAARKAGETLYAPRDGV